MDLSVRLVGLLQRIIALLLLPLYWWRGRGPRRTVPPVRDDILLQSAVSLARKIRTGQLTSESVVRAYFARLAEVDPVVNGVVASRLDAALAEAVDVDELVASGRHSQKQMEEDTPFLGVPVTFKETCRLTGMPLTGGSVSRKGVRATGDGLAVARMRRAGAVPIAVTNTPELCYSWETYNHVRGRTLNPYDTRRTCGGSSGGEFPLDLLKHLVLNLVREEVKGAILGSAGSVIGVGSDLAGSIRIPALYNGIFGHKPTPHLVPIDGHFPPMPDPRYPDYLTLGPVGRYAEDLGPVLRVLAGPDADSLRLQDKVNLKSLRVFYMLEAARSMTTVPVSSEIKAAVQRAASYLQDRCGLTVTKADIKEMGDSAEIALAALFEMEGIPKPFDYRPDSAYSKNAPSMAGELAKAVLGLSDFTHYALAFDLMVSSPHFLPASQYPKYARKREKLKAIFLSLLGDDGVFLYPTHPEVASHHGESFTKTTGIMYTAIFNVLGLPATHVPLGLNKRGLPVGVQVVAAPYQDRLCFAVAQELERGFGGWVPPAL